MLLQSTRSALFVILYVLVSKQEYVLWNAVSVPLPRWMYTALFLAFLNVDDIVIIITDVENFNQHRWI